MCKMATGQVRSTHFAHVDVCMAWVCQTSGFVHLSGTVVCHNAVVNVLGFGKSVPWGVSKYGMTRHFRCAF